MIASRTTSITELRNHLADVLDSLNESGSVMIVRHSKPAAYLVSPEVFEGIFERLEDLIDRQDMEAALADYHQGRGVPADEVFKRLGL